VTFRYWSESGDETVIHDVDRVVYNTGDKIEVRFLKDGTFWWKHLTVCVDFLNFIVSLT